MCGQNLTFVALFILEIIGGTPKNSAVLGYAHAPFPPKYEGRSTNKLQNGAIPSVLKIGKIGKIRNIRFVGNLILNMAHVGVSQSRSLKLFGREIIFQEFQPM